MMRSMMRAMLMLAISNVLFTSCAKENEDGKFTKATIKLVDSQQRPIKGIVVYAYTEDTWMIIGDDPLFADGQSASNSNGEAIFTNIEYPTCFNAINNYQNTFRFSAHYTINSIPKIKVAAVTFNKGDSTTETMILD